MTISPLIASLLAATGVLAFFAGLFVPGRPKLVQARLDAFTMEPRSLEEIEMRRTFVERIIWPLARYISQFIYRRMPPVRIEELRRQLIMAGNPRGWEVNDFLGVKGLMAFGVTMFVLTIFSLLELAFSSSLLVAACFGGVSFYIPNFWLKRKIASRQSEILLALPDCLDLLTISVEAGLGFDGAVQRVVTKADNALAEEFERMLAEIRVGRPRREALREMADRIQVQEVSAVITAVVQADQLGVGIARALRVQADQMRVHRRQRAEKLAHEAPVKMLIPMAIFFFPTIYIVILGPILPRLLKMFG